MFEFEKFVSQGTGNFYDSSCNNYYNIPEDHLKDFFAHCLIKLSDKHRFHEVVPENVARPFQVNIQIHFSDLPTEAMKFRSLRSGLDSYVRNIIPVVRKLTELHFIGLNSHLEQTACYCRYPDNKFLDISGNYPVFNCKIIFPYLKVSGRTYQSFRKVLVDKLIDQNIIPGNFINVDIPNQNTSNVILPCDEGLYPIFTPDYEIKGIYQNMKPSEYNIGDITTLTKLYRDIEYDQLALRAIFNPRNCPLYTELESVSLKDWAPLFFSTFFKSDLLPFNTSNPLPIDNVLPPASKYAKISVAHEMLKIINPAKYIHVEYLRMIGKSIYKEFPNEQGYNLWMQIYTKQNNLNISAFNDLWGEFRKNRENNVRDIETLKWLAYKDNEVEYSNFYEEEYEKLISEAILNPEHAEIAKVFKNIYNFKFVHSNGELYTYIGHGYIDDNMSTIDNMLLNDFPIKFEEYRMKLVNVQSRTDSQEERKRLEMNIKCTTDLIKTLSKHNFRVSVRNDIITLITDNNFINKLDEGKYLTGAANGVIDVESKKHFFRPGTPQDYLSRSTTYYDETLTRESPVIHETMLYFYMMFGSANMVKYVIDFLTSLLIAGNIDKILPIFTGEGNNGKSMFIKLIFLAFGTYIGTLPVSVLTEERGDPNGTSPAIISSKHQRASFLNEPSKNKKIVEGPAKEITGMDDMYGRDLFQKGKKIKKITITTVPVLVANKIPKIPDCTPAIWLRTKIFRCDTTYVKAEDLPKSISEQWKKRMFKIDKQFVDTLPRKAVGVLWLCVNNVEKYFQQGGLIDIPEVIAATEEFRIDNNWYYKFISEVFIKSEDIEDAVGYSAAFTRFKSWFKGTGEKYQGFTKSEFVEQALIILKQDINADQKFTGYIMKEDENAPFFFS